MDDDRRRTSISKSNHCLGGDVLPISVLTYEFKSIRKKIGRIHTIIPWCVIGNKTRVIGKSGGTILIMSIAWIHKIKAG